MVRIKSLAVGLFALLTSQFGFAGAPPIPVESMVGVNGQVNIDEVQIGPSDYGYLVDVLNPNLNIVAFAVTLPYTPFYTLQQFDLSWDAQHWDIATWNATTSIDFLSLFGPGWTGVNVYGYADVLAGTPPFVGTPWTDLVDDDLPSINTPDFQFGGFAPGSNFAAFAILPGTPDLQLVDWSNENYDPGTNQTPAPSVLFLLAGGLLGLAWRQRSI